MNGIDRRDFLKGVSAALVLPHAAGFGRCTEEEVEKPPNIVLIMADDLGTECLGCYQGSSYKTPNIDALASQGVRFENCYCTPLCTPSRVQLMLGQYPFRSGWYKGIWLLPEEEQLLDPKQPNFAHVLKSRGYATAVAGKWQLGHFEDRPDHAEECGFDEHCLWRWAYGDVVYSRYWSPGIWQNGKPLEDAEGKFAPDIYTQFMIDFIRRNASGPFFAYYSMTLPHEPFIMPPGAEEDQEGTKEGGMRAQKNFKAMVEYMDGLVGQIVRTVDGLGLREKTLILFTSDNGTPMQIHSNLKRRRIPGGKFMLNESGSRVPLIASWQGETPKESVCDALVDFTDVMPTFAELAGAELPRDVHLDGKSFLPLIRGRIGEIRKWVFCQKGSDWFIRDKRYRLRSNGKFHDMRYRYAPKPIENNPDPKAAAAKKRLEEAAKNLLKKEG